MKKKEEASFEEAMERLKDASEMLDRGGLTLEETVRAYEEGVAHARLCRKRLDDARGRLLKLEESPDGIRESPVELEEAGQ